MSICDDYILVWEENFGGSDINEQNWKFSEGGGGFGNNELQFYTNHRKENCTIKNEILNIVSQMEEYNLHDFTSCKLISKKAWRYGKFEIKAKLPLAIGVWPAIWMMPTSDSGLDWPDCGEIDIMEYFGIAYGKVESSLHTTKYNFYSNNKYNIKTDLKENIREFNIYGMEWDENRIEFFINGEITKKMSKDKDAKFSEWPFDQYFHLILNLAVGGDYAGMYDIDSSSWPQYFEIDYIKVYQKKKDSINNI